MIRLLTLTAAFGLLTGCSTGQPDNVAHDPFTVSTYRSESGWGYSIAVNGKACIKQPYIPAINGKVPFHNQQEALKTGNYVCSLMRNRKLPALRKSDLVQLGIITDTLSTATP